MIDTPSFEQWFHGITRNWMCDDREIEHTHAIARAAYVLGQRSSDTLSQRVCKTLEGITLNDLDEDPFRDMVYRFCHIARGRCKNPHEDWIAEFEKVEGQIAKANASPLAKRWIERQRNENKTRIREQ